MSRAKGNRTRRKAINYFKEDNYLVDIVEQTSRWTNSKDLFSNICTNCWNTYEEDTACCSNNKRFSGFDIVALKPKEFILIQIKTNNPATQQEYIDFAKKYASSQIKVLCMTWYDRQGWVLQWYQQNGKIKKVDLRKQ